MALIKSAQAYFAGGFGRGSSLDRRQANSQLTFEMVLHARVPIGSSVEYQSVGARIQANADKANAAGRHQAALSSPSPILRATALGFGVADYRTTNDTRSDALVLLF
jgi:hypothetical protein